MGHMYSRGQQPCKFVVTKEIVWREKEFNFQRTGVGCQHRICKGLCHDDVAILGQFCAEVSS